MNNNNKEKLSVSHNSRGVVVSLAGNESKEMTVRELEELITKLKEASICCVDTTVQDTNTSDSIKVFASSSAEYENCVHVRMTNEEEEHSVHLSGESARRLANALYRLTE